MGTDGPRRGATARPGPGQLLGAPQPGFHDIVERITDGVLVVDADGIVRYANPAARALLGRSSVAGHHLGIPLATGVTELELVTPAGIRTAELQVVQGLCDDSFTLALLHDVTDRQQAELDMIRLNTELTRSNADLTAFARSVAHDLKQPLADVLLRLQSLRGHLPPADETAAGLLAGSQAALADMASLIDAMLGAAAAHGEVGRGRVEVEELARSLSRELDPDRAIVKVGALPAVETDRHLLANVLRILLANAVEHAGPGAWVEVSAERSYEEWRFAVSDDGPGVPEAWRERVFEQAWRPPGQGRSGRGIGLATARRSVERLGGRIWVETAPAGGARFVFSLPDPP